MTVAAFFCLWQSCTVYLNLFQSYTELETKRFCCPGFKIGTQTPSLTCEPVCEPPCLNSVCEAPDQCRCDHGFEKRNGTENICEPVCSEPCENGYCSNPELCFCHVGYQLDSSHQYVCKPVCTTPCVNALCSSPDVCSCHPGYTKTTEDTHKCQAHCSTPCHNAVCSRPEECTCFDGYKKDDYNSNTCIPICDNECTNAVCTGPNFCTCFDGFQVLGEDYYSCKPVCSDECHNAFCSAPQQCTCLFGYEMDLEDNSTCTPVCSQKCVNATCTAPNVCECSHGYERTDDPSVCKPFCSNGCNNAICTEPEVCTCLWGYQRDGHNSSGCPTESEKHKCLTVNKVIGYSYDKTCFFVTSELKIEKLTNCKILQEMLAKQNENNGDKGYLSLKCEAASYFTVNEINLDLEMVCDIVLEERTLTTIVKEITTERPQYFLTDEDYSTIDESFPSSGTYTSEDGASLEEIFQTSVDTIIKNKIETKEDLDEKSMWNKFKIVFNKSTTIDVSIMNGQNIPLNLNITLQFLPFITQTAITQSYFDHNSTYLDQDWCLCTKNSPW